MEVSENAEDKLAAVPDSSANPEVGPEPAGEDQASAAAPPQALHELPLGTPPRMSLASAFSALLAAEQSQSPLQTRRPTPPQLSDMAVEEMVRRALSRMTDDAVRRIVLETAERLVREEIDKIKSQPS